MAVAERKQKSRSRKLSSVSDSMNALSAPQSPSETGITTSPISSGSAHSYVRPQSLGKAVHKSVRSLPYSPTKRRLVVAGLAMYVGFRIETDTEMQLSSNPGNQGLTAEALSTINQFYFQSDIVYTAPEMRDEITEWKDGKKIKLQKYFLTMFLREAYAIFQSLHPNAVSFSKFCSFHPQNGLLLKNSPTDKCRCHLQENFRLKLKSLIGDYGQSFWEKILCYSNDLYSDWWKGQCEKKLMMPDGSNSSVSRMEWKKDSSEWLTKMSESGAKSALKSSIARWTVSISRTCSHQTHSECSFRWRQDHMPCVPGRLCSGVSMWVPEWDTLWACDSVTLCSVLALVRPS